MHKEYEKLALVKLLESFNQAGILYPQSTVVTELTMDSYSARADVVLCGEDIHIFELKSEADSLSRLNHQLDSYRKFSNRTTVVCAEKHLDKVIIQTPKNIGVMLLTDKGVEPIRTASSRPITKLNLIRLLNVREIRSLLRKSNIIVENHQSRRDQLEELAMKLDLATLNAEVLHALKVRYEGINSDLMQSVSKTKKLTLSTLATLERPRQRSDRTKIVPNYDDDNLTNMALSYGQKTFGKVPNWLDQFLKT